jgi:hypothetical protein
VIGTCGPRGLVDEVRRAIAGVDKKTAVAVCVLFLGFRPFFRSPSCTDPLALVLLLAAVASRAIARLSDFEAVHFFLRFQSSWSRSPLLVLRRPFT